MVIYDEIDTLVCSGGGTKGIAYVGIIKYLDELKKNRELEEKKPDFCEKDCIYPKINIKRIKLILQILKVLIKKQKGK